jgi:hypothetical protein
MKVILKLYNIISKYVLWKQNWGRIRQMVCVLPCYLLKAHLYRKNMKYFWGKNGESTETISQV